MKVTVTNTALLNTGDAAIMDGTTQILRRAFGKHVEIAVRDQQAGAIGEIYPDYHCGPVFHDLIRDWKGERRMKSGMRRLLTAAALWRTPLRNQGLRLLPEPLARSLRQFLESDLIVSAGGTYLVPHYRQGPKLLELLVARLAGRPYILFTQSLGPFQPGQRLLRMLLRHARLVLVRDPRSAAHLREIGVPEERIHECADAAFALTAPAAILPRRRRRVLEIAVSVRDWPHFAGDSAAGMEDYLEAVALLVRHLVEDIGARVTFLSTCQGNGSYWTDDSRIAAKVVARLPQPVADLVQIDGEFHTPDRLRECLGAFDLFVATRMHGAILALGAGVPVVPIAYEFKTVELFRRVRLTEYVQEMNGICAEKLCHAVDTALRAREDLRLHIAGEIRNLERSAYSAAPRLRHAMRNAA